MKPNRIRGYTLETTPEVHAALWSARATGNEPLADYILRAAEPMQTKDATIGKVAELGRPQTKEMLRALGSVTAGEVELHRSYVEEAELMIEQHNRFNDRDRLPISDEDLAISS